MPTPGTDCHASEPPDTVGALGALRSSRAVFSGPGAAGAHGEALPAPSSARYWTSVEPSALIVAAPPATGADHVDPASLEARYSSPAKPDPPESPTAVPVIVIGPAVCHASDPPATDGVPGTVRSRRTMDAGEGVAGAQAEACPE